MSRDQKWITPTVRQTWVVLPTLLAKMTVGMTLGFTSCFLAAIDQPDSDIKMDLSTSTWFVSSMGVSVTIGYIMVSTTITKFGRRKAFIINSIPSIIGIFCTIFGKNVFAIVVGKILVDISLQCNCSIGVIAIGEFASISNRGTFFNLATAMLNVGILLVHVLGHYFSWRVLAGVIAIPLITAALIAYTWPESPTWLAERQQEEKSREAFYWLRGRTEETRREIEELIKSQKRNKMDRTILERIKEFFLKFKKRNFLMPLFVFTNTILLMEFSGRHVFPSYAAQLIKEMVTTDLDQFSYNIVIDVLVVLSGLTAAFLIRIMRIRTLLFSTGIVTVIALTAACITLYFVKSGIFSIDYSWVPLTLFAIYIIFTNLGCTCVPLMICGEILPLEHKVVLTTIGGYIYAISMSTVLKVMPYAVIALEIYGAFEFLAVGVVITLIVLYFTLPETTNKTLQEIENFFTYGKYNDGEVLPTDEYESLDGVQSKIGV